MGWIDTFWNTYSNVDTLNSVANTSAVQSRVSELVNLGYTLQIAQQRAIVEHLVGLEVSVIQGAVSVTLAGDFALVGLISGGIGGGVLGSEIPIVGTSVGAVVGAITGRDWRRRLLGYEIGAIPFKFT
jgi:hypothetical protein